MGFYSFFEQRFFLCQPFCLQELHINKSKTMTKARHYKKTVYGINKQLTKS